MTRTITIEIPSDHPCFRAHGGEAFSAAAHDLVGLARKAKAVQQMGALAGRALMAQYQNALGTVCGPGDLVQQLREMGVTDFHATKHPGAGTLDGMFALWMADRYPEFTAWIQAAEAKAGERDAA